MCLSDCSSSQIEIWRADYCLGNCRGGYYPPAQHQLPQLYCFWRTRTNLRPFRRGAHWASARYTVTYSNHDGRIRTILWNYTVISKHSETIARRTPNGRPYERNDGFYHSSNRSKVVTRREDDIPPTVVWAETYPLNFNLRICCAKPISTSCNTNSLLYKSKNVNQKNGGTRKCLRSV